MAHSSSGLGHRPLKAEITGSNPVCATKSRRLGMFPGAFCCHSEACDLPNDCWKVVPE